MRHFPRSWRDPGHWRRSWNRVSGSSKAGLAVMLALLVWVGGYFAAKGLAGAADSTAADVQVITFRRVVYKTNGQSRAVTRVESVVVAGTAQTILQRVTARQSGATEIVTKPGQVETVLRTVTVQRPGRDRVVTDSRPQTVVRAETVDRPVTVTTAVTRPVAGPTQTVTNRVTTPGGTVTGPTQTVTNRVTTPGRTVTGPTQTVTSPGRTVTVTRPAQTVTSTVTQPARTVTETRRGKQTPSRPRTPSPRRRRSHCRA